MPKSHPHKFTLKLEVTSREKLNKTSKKAVGKMMAENAANNSWHLPCAPGYSTSVHLGQIKVKKW